MDNTNTTATAIKLREHVAFAKEYRNGVLCFIFRGISKKAVCDTFRKLKDVCNSSVAIEPVHKMTNGTCHRDVVVRITAAGNHTIQEDELKDMVVHFIGKRQCEVTYFSDLSKFLNT